jgi:hypothetical protein
VKIAPREREPGFGGVLALVVIAAAAAVFVSRRRR